MGTFFVGFEWMCCGILVDSNGVFMWFNGIYPWNNGDFMGCYQDHGDLIGILMGFCHLPPKMVAWMGFNQQKKKDLLIERWWLLEDLTNESGV